MASGKGGLSKKQRQAATSASSAPSPYVTKAAKKADKIGRAKRGERSSSRRLKKKENKDLLFSPSSLSLLDLCAGDHGEEAAQAQLAAIVASAPPIQMVTTKLAEVHQPLIEKLCKLSPNITISDRVTEKTSHIITSPVSRRNGYQLKARTMKYFKGLLQGAFILSIDWS